MQSKQRYHLLDHQVLEELLRVTGRFGMQSTRREWVEEAIRRNFLERDSCWSDSLAVGDEEFVAGVRVGLGIKGWNRKVTKEGDGFVLRENEVDYAILLLKEANSIAKQILGQVRPRAHMLPDAAISEDRLELLVKIAG